VLTQLLAAAGAHVIAVTRAANDEYVHSLGAADVVAHDRADTGDALRRIRPGGIDVLIDLVSDRERFADLAATVRNGGLAMSGVAAADVAALEASGRRGVNVATKPAATTLEALDAVWAKLALKLPEIRVLSLDGALDAIDELQRGHVRGKLVVNLESTVPG
jgi:D-arabinose 1-dehydrogenase-like Zn-dependent alcohol dehydrogenase